jgi:hypothetical protein
LQPAVDVPAGPANGNGQRDPGDSAPRLFLALLAFLVYNANLRDIAAGDIAHSIPAVLLFGVMEPSIHPVADVTISYHSRPYWIVLPPTAARLHARSTPVLLLPLYVPACSIWKLPVGRTRTSRQPAI